MSGNVGRYTQANILDPFGSIVISSQVLYVATSFIPYGVSLPQVLLSWLVMSTRYVGEEGETLHNGNPHPPFTFLVTCTVYT